MHQKRISLECELPPIEMESEVTKILKQNNFYIIDDIQEEQGSDSREVKGYAEGKYDNEDLALSITMQKVADQTNKLVIKAMSNREEKIIDILKEISSKCDDLRSTKESLPSVEIECKNCKNSIHITEQFMEKTIVICEECGEEITIPKEESIEI